jgi:hypothetical protein
MLAGLDWRAGDEVVPTPMRSRRVRGELDEDSSEAAEPLTTAVGTVSPGLCCCCCCCCCCCSKEYDRDRTAASLARRSLEKVGLLVGRIVADKTSATAQRK